MDTFLNRSLLGFLILVLLQGCQPKEQSLEDKIAMAIKSRKLPSAENQKILFSFPDWVEERSELNSFILRHMEDYLPTVAIDRGEMEITQLPEHLSRTLGGEMLSSPHFKKETTLDQLCEKKSINGVIVLHKGQIIYEKYPDMVATERHNFFSVSKSLAGTVIAALADQGKINEQDSIATYISEFRNKPLGKVSVENILRMSSGINCREALRGSDPCFLEFDQYFNIRENKTVFEKPLMAFLADRGVHEPAGKTYDYTSPNTAILATLAERVSGKPYHELVSALIWSKIGAEADARIVLSSLGNAGSHGFIMARLRDLARYGLAFTEDAPRKIASDRYLKLLREGDHELYLTDKPFAAIFAGQGAAFQSYHWDVTFEDGDFTKGGHGGQGIYISPEKRLVIAFFSAAKNETRDNQSLFDLVRSLALLKQFNKAN